MLEAVRLAITRRRAAEEGLGFLSADRFDLVVPMDAPRHDGQLCAPCARAGEAARALSHRDAGARRRRGFPAEPTTTW